MRSYRPIQTWLALSGFLIACHSSLDGHGANSGATVSGVVSDEAGVGIAGASLLVGTGGSAATTAADGSFSAVAKGAVGATVPVSLTHPLHANLASTLYLGGKALKQNFVMRAYGTTQDVTLPTDPNAPLIVAQANADAGVTLSIAAGSLVLADGSPATGHATVSLTFWHPNQPNASVPAPLYGTLSNDNSFVDLVTYGMADIEIRQGNNSLQIAPNKWLELNFSLPPNLVGLAANANAGDADAPGLWYADHSTGAWHRTAVLGDSNLTFAAQSNTLVARIPHLSAWNVDGIIGTNGCVSGQAVDGCGTALANANLTLWLYNSEELAQFAFTTAGDGSFCVGINGSGDNTSSGTGRQASAYFWLSAQNDPNSAACNPTGKSTFSALCNNINPKNSHSCAGHDPWSAAGKKQRPSFEISDAAFASCNIPLANVDLCGYCAGGTPYAQCTKVVGSVYSSTGQPVAGRCTSVGTLKTGYCGTSTTPPNCADAKNRPVAGSPCSQTVDCCAPGILECADATCVPVD